MSVNALLAGVTAGILREMRDGSFRDGFAAGALGGAVAYGGRRLAAEEFAGAGLLARQVGAVGVSMVRNAAEAQPALSYVYVPIGPVTLRIDGRQRSVRARLDAYATTILLSAIFDDRVELDGRATLSSGAPVFRTPGYHLESDDRRVTGMAPAGVIVLGHPTPNLRDEDLLAHERVHVLQHDFANQLWGDPLESWIGDKVPGGDRLLRYIQPGIAYPMIETALVRLFDVEWASRPWEIEAEYLESR